MKITWGTWRGWEVYIEASGGNRLPEHRVTHYPANGLEPATSKVFVEYHDGQEFALHAFNNTARNYKAKVTYSVDSRVLQPFWGDEHSVAPITQRHSHEKVNGQLWTKSLRFEPLHRVANGHMVDRETEEQLGTITIGLQQGTPGRSALRLPLESPPPHSILNVAIKPDVLSYVGGQELTPTEPVPLYPWTNTAGMDSYRVVFHYFKRDTLMAMNVIPNPSATPRLRAVTEQFDEIEPYVRWHLHNRNRDPSEDSTATLGDDPFEFARFLVAKFFREKGVKRKYELDSRSSASSVSSDISSISYRLRAPSVTPSGKVNPFRRQSANTGSTGYSDDSSTGGVKRRRQSTIEIRL